MRLAAIDIGSNAVRLLFCDVYPYQDGNILRKTSLVRLPIRLGEDVFVNKVISKKNSKKLLKTIQAFKNLVDVYDVTEYRVCATSAMREAENGKAIIKNIKKETGVKVEIIAGEEEAELIYQTHIAEKIDAQGTFLYMDVGGGSTEFTLFSNGKREISKSFQLGTIRLKNDLVDAQLWLDIENWLNKIKKKHQPSLVIGTGGNINKLYKLCGLKDYKLLAYADLKQMFSFLENYSVENRITKLGLKPDRADVITHAAKIYLTTLKAVGVKEMFVPKVGLADGIIQEMYDQHHQK